jgi:hypothetical protein
MKEEGEEERRGERDVEQASSKRSALLLSPLRQTALAEAGAEASKRTVPLPSLVAHALLQRPLLLERPKRIPRQRARRGASLTDGRRLMRGRKVFGDDALAFRVEDDDAGDRVEGEVRHRLGGGSCG